MKLNLDEAASARPLTLTLSESASDAPEVFQTLLTIEGIQSVFVINDFVTLTRKGSADWQPILAAAGRLLGLAEDAEATLGDRLQADIPPAEKASSECWRSELWSSRGSHSKVSRHSCPGAGDRRYATGPRGATRAI